MLEVNAACNTDTMSYPPYGGQGSYPPAPAGGYPPHSGQPAAFPVCNYLMYLSIVITCVLDGDETWLR